MTQVRGSLPAHIPTGMRVTGRVHKDELDSARQVKDSSFISYPRLRASWDAARRWRWFDGAHVISLLIFVGSFYSAYTVKKPRLQGQLY